MYGGPLHNPAFIETILSYLPDLDKSTYATSTRIEGMLSTALEETCIQGDPEAAAKEEQVDKTSGKDDTESTKPARLVPRMDPAEQDRHPFFWFPSALAKVVHARAPSEAEVKGALRHAGYRAVRSHCKAGAIRTDAPWTFIWEMMREWVRQKAPIKEDSIKPVQAGYKIMKKGVQAKARAVEEDDGKKTNNGTGEEMRKIEEGNEEVTTDAADTTTTTTDGGKWEVVFDQKLGKEGERKRGRRLVRYQVNPRENWGPMTKAKKGGAKV